MADSMREHSVKTFQTLCNMLDNNDWHYQKHEDDLVITCGAQGDDLPMEIIIRIDVGRQIVLLLSEIPFTVEVDKRMETAVAVSIVNNRLVDGCFDFDISSGDLFFRMTSSFVASEISEDVFKYMLYCSCIAIDEYNDKFLMLSKGMISIESFMKDNV